MFMEPLELTSDIKDLCYKKAFWLYLCNYFSGMWLDIFNPLHSQTFSVMQSNLHMFKRILHQRQPFHPSPTERMTRRLWMETVGRRRHAESIAGLTSPISLPRPSLKAKSGKSARFKGEKKMQFGCKLRVFALGFSLAMQIFPYCRVPSAVPDGGLDRLC